MEWGSVAQGVGPWALGVRSAVSVSPRASHCWGTQGCALRGHSVWGPRQSGCGFWRQPRAKLPVCSWTLRAFSGCSTDWGAVDLVGFPNNIAQLRNCNWWCARSWIKIIIPHDTFTPMIRALHYHHIRKVYLFGVELTGESSWPPVTHTCTCTTASLHKITQMSILWVLPECAGLRHA